MPVIGTGMSNQSCASADHGPIVTTNDEAGTDSPSTFTPVTRLPSPSASVSTPSTLPMRISAPLATAASTSLVHSSYGAT